jgi:hypothetical protein
MPNLLETLTALEISLHDPKIRSDAVQLGALLHLEFKEFGRSGAVYTRTEIVSRLSGFEAQPKIHAQDFAVDELSSELALLTYRSAHIDETGALHRHTNRSSLWQLTELGWQMRFHQGTPTEAW